MDDFTITDETPMTVTSSDNWALRRADVVFIIDCTRTMDTTLQVVLNTIEEVVGVYEKANVKIRMGLTEFRDQQYPEDEMKDLHLHHHHEFGESYFTEEVDLFSESLKQLVARGGGPMKESCFDALVSTAENLDWGAGSDRVLVFFSDAQPRQKDVLITGGVDEAANRLKDSGVNQIHLVIDKLQFEKDYYEILLIPNPSNPDEEDIPGGTYDIYQSGKAKLDEDRKASFEGLKKVLMSIARTSGSIVAGSRSSNPYITPGIKRRRKIPIDDASKPHRVRPTDTDDDDDSEEQNRSSGNPFVRDQ